MKIAVCIKAVPDTETKIKIASDNQHIDLAEVRFIVSPYDEFAIEEALKLKEKHGGETTVFCLGGNESVDVLRDALARGIDNAVHIKDADFESLDPLGTGKVLASAIKDNGFEVILCGQQGVGGDNSQVPAVIAELLDLPQATFVVKLEIENGQFKAEREIEGAHEIIAGQLPAVFSAQKGLNEPRYPSIKGVMAARRKEIVNKDAEALGLKGQVSKAQIRQMSMPPERPQGRKIEGDAATQAKELAHLLRTEVKLI